jgi:hypothetical protein
VPYLLLPPSSLHPLLDLPCSLHSSSIPPQLVARATSFLGTVVKMPSQRSLFENQQTLEAFCEKIVLPNMTLRTFEEELFEDDPAEYVRRDLESASASRLPPVPSPLSNRMW